MVKRLNDKTGKILLIGDIGKAFLDVSEVTSSCEVCSNMDEGIEAAAKNNFAGVAVVMSGAGRSPAPGQDRLRRGRLSLALKGLRQANRDAKIILLARMSEEPTAMELVERGFDGTSAADDYLICPLHFLSLESHILHLAGREVGVSQDVVVAIDLKTQKKIEQLEKLATEDDLTGLKNRRYIWEFSSQIIEQARRENGRVTLLVFDIDDFKRYNDAYGHRTGDEILKQAAILMRRCCRQHDIVGRIGGDEFAVVFWDVPKPRQVGGEEAERRSAMADHPKEAIFIAKRLVRELEKAELHLLGPAGRGVLTISGGLASFPRDGSTMQELFGRADGALLEAKRSGKNRIYLVGKPQSDIADIQ